MDARTCDLDSVALHVLQCIDTRLTTNYHCCLHENFKKLYNSTISYGSFINLKPFYIARPTEKETEMCLCSKCLNPHCLFKAIRSTIESNNLPSSLSEYLCKGFKCDPEIDTHYHTRECILGKCVNKCKITDIEKDLENESASLSKKVRYYVFETVYYNKKGKLVSYNLILVRLVLIKKNHSRLLLKSFNFRQKITYYTNFFVVNDKVYWKNFLGETTYYTLWLDYSQNIAFTEKKQVQSANFSVRQHTLHNTIIQSLQGEITYVYHLYDDTNYDSVMTFHIIRDILRHHPEIVTDGVLVLRSDNCQEQYKCKYIFFEMKKIAIEYNINVVWFYGEPGHGRGLVDAMSSFGCKQQLRHEIVLNDTWFSNAEQMVEFLSSFLSSDKSTEYHHVDAAETAKVRSTKRGEFELKACRKFHVIAVSKDGFFLPDHCFSEIRTLFLQSSTIHQCRIVAEMMMMMSMMMLLMNNLSV